MVSLLSRSVHKFRAGVAIRKDTWIGKPTAGNDSFQHECHCFYTMRNFLQRSSFLNVTSEKGNNSTGTYIMATVNQMMPLSGCP